MKNPEKGLSCLIIILISLTSCFTVSEIPREAHNTLIEGVPFYPQEAYQCGPSSLAGVLNYWGVYVSPDDIAQEIFSESVKGTLNLDMLLYTKRKGLRAVYYSGSIKDIKRNIDLGYPLIVLVDLGISLYQANHFMVVIGYNEKGLIVNSGKKRESFVREEDFLRAWKKTDFWTLLIKK
ncbi:MAG: C39 family peptidase [Nitrospirota bacterium]